MVVVDELHLIEKERVIIMRKFSLFFYLRIISGPGGGGVGGFKYLTEIFCLYVT
jgi:hypothetical protein